MVGGTKRFVEVLLGVPQLLFNMANMTLELLRMSLARLESLMQLNFVCIYFGQLSTDIHQLLGQLLMLL
ncbi:hypothetical protein D3C84_1137020 [compost metagenome]